MILLRHCRRYSGASAFDAMVYALIMLIFFDAPLLLLLLATNIYAALWLFRYICFITRCRHARRVAALLYFMLSCRYAYDAIIMPPMMLIYAATLLLPLMMRYCRQRVEDAI